PLAKVITTPSLAAAANNCSAAAAVVLFNKAASPLTVRATLGCTRSAGTYWAGASGRCLFTMTHGLAGSVRECCDLIALKGCAGGAAASLPIVDSTAAGSRVAGADTGGTDVGGTVVGCPCAKAGAAPTDGEGYACSGVQLASAPMAAPAPSNIVTCRRVMCGNPEAFSWHTCARPSARACDGSSGRRLW